MTGLVRVDLLDDCFWYRDGSSGLAPAVKVAGLGYDFVLVWNGILGSDGVSIGAWNVSMCWSIVGSLDSRGGDRYLGLLAI